MSRVEAKNLHFHYVDGEQVLRGVNISLEKESTAIIGQNGAGKTTFIKLLKGLLKPVAGDVFINGHNTRAYTAASLAKDIGLVFQNPNDQIFKNKTMDEVMFGPLNIGQSRDEARHNSLEALEAVGLSDKASENPYDLSLAERKLITIASVLAMKPGIIIFDEPTIAQDYQGREMIKRIIKDLRHEGKLVLTVTHDMDFVAETFERTVVFQDGRVLLDAVTREVYGNVAELRSAYLEPPHITQLGQKLAWNTTVLTTGEFVRHYKEGQAKPSC